MRCTGDLMALGKMYSPLQGFNWWTCPFYLFRVPALYVSVHRRNSVHVAPMLRGILSSGYTFVAHEHSNLSLDIGGVNATDVGYREVCFWAALKNLSPWLHLSTLPFPVLFNAISLATRALCHTLPNGLGISSATVLRSAKWRVAPFHYSVR